jgi:two-component system response regulator PilR (NtrC family)
MQQVRSLVEKVARSMAPVLVQGESGTGKELVARAIHDCSPRAAGPFVAVNCGAIPEALLEAEFFGYRKGAFTGANEDREGFFQAAQGGTLFLDEIGDLPLAMQSKLLRVIQERAVRPLGAVAELPVNVRIVSATHKDLGAEVQAGRFRQDLYYRLNVIRIGVPPLRERMEDLPGICASGARAHRARCGRHARCPAWPVTPCST